MAAPQSSRQRSLIRQHDRRRNQRVTVNLLGRFMLEDRREFPCQTQDMSPGSVALTTPIVGRIGERSGQFEIRYPLRIVADKCDQIREFRAAYCCRHKRDVLIPIQRWYSLEDGW